MRKLGLALAALALMPVGPAAATHGPRPPDYTDTSDLSKPMYRDVVRERVQVEMRDGVRLYAEVVRPRASGRFGAILELSPYHGNLQDRNGGRVLPGVGLAAYFPPRGYAVVFADLRGTGNSEGCLDLLGPVDRLDGYDLVEWIARRPWSNGRVGMTGVSYVGSTPIAVAAARPPHLRTIVPVAGIAQMYDHQFQAGVPYFLQWVGPAGSYEQLAAQPPDNRDQPGWARNVANAGCGLPGSAAVSEGPDFFTGRYTPWHAARDYRSAAAGAPIPIFLVQGLTDGAVRPIATEWFLRERRVRRGDKLWLGQWDHNPSDRGLQWRGALHRWFDRHLKGLDVDTGPPVEGFLNADWGGSGGPIRTAYEWPRTRSWLRLYPRAGGALGTTASAPADLDWVALPTAQPAVGTNVGGAVFDSSPLARDTVLSGFPRVTLNAALFGGRVDLMVSLYDVADVCCEGGMITHAAINPELRAGLGVVMPIVPGETMRLHPPAWPTEYLVRKGHRIRLIVAARHQDKAPLFPGPGVVRLMLGGGDPTRIEVGVVARPALYPDDLRR